MSDFGRMTEEGRTQDIAAVKASLEQERKWRDEKAAARGWTMHPNDMGLEGPELDAVLYAWRTRAPQPEYHQGK